MWKGRPLGFLVFFFFSLLFGHDVLVLFSLSLMAIFASLNVNGLCDVRKREASLQWLNHFGADFVSLQETHVTTPQECQAWFSASGFFSLTSVGTSHSCGSVLLYKPVYTFLRSWADEEGRFVMGEFSLHGVTFRVASVYASNRNPGREEFFDYVVDQVDPGVPTVVCGV